MGLKDISRAMSKHISPADIRAERAKQIVAENGLIVVPITIVLQLQHFVWQQSTQGAGLDLASVIPGREHNLQGIQIAASTIKILKD